MMWCNNPKLLTLHLTWDKVIRTFLSWPCLKYQGTQSRSFNNFTVCYLLYSTFEINGQWTWLWDWIKGAHRFQSSGELRLEPSFVHCLRIQTLTLWVQIVCHWLYQVGIILLISPIVFQVAKDSLIPTPDTYHANISALINNSHLANISALPTYSRSARNPICSNSNSPSANRSAVTTAVCWTGPYRNCQLFSRQTFISDLY